MFLSQLLHWWKLEQLSKVDDVDGLHGQDHTSTSILFRSRKERGVLVAVKLEVCVKHFKGVA